jgi:signal transduction histidine kinase
MHRRLLIDLAAAAVVAASGIATALGSPDDVLRYPAALNVLAALALAAPLLARRAHPVAAQIAIYAVVFAWLPAWGLGTQAPLATWLAVMVGFYSLGAYGHGRGADAAALIGLALEPLPDAVAALTGNGSLTSDDLLGPGILAALWIAARTIRRRGLLAEVLRRERDERAQLAAAQERARIARELHDVISHNVTVMVVEAAAERRRRPDDGETVASLRSIERTGRETLTELRRLLGVLRAPDHTAELAPQPRLADVERLAEDLAGRGLVVTLHAEGQPRELPAGVDLTAYRVIQEALTNVVKHAGEARAEVRVRYGADALEIVVLDDGRGPNGDAGGGHGLAGMRERVAMVGGALSTGPGEAGGYAVVASLPLGTP